MITIYDKKTGKPRAVEVVDAREMMKYSPDLYSLDDPSGKKKADDPDGDGREAAPVNIDVVENPYRREPVGADNPEPERRGTIIRNPVTDQPLMAPRESAESSVTVPSKDELEGMTVPELRDYASSNQVDLSGTTHKAEIIKEIRKEQRKKAAASETA